MAWRSRTIAGAILAAVTPSTRDAEPACPAAPVHSAAPTPTLRDLHAERRAFDSIPPDVWNAFARCNPWATPFALWPFNRAWWDAYGANAHDDTLVLTEAETGTIVGIAPLMHRHEVEPSDAATHTTLRHGSDERLTPVAPTATAVFFGASYHSDYATLLCAPADLASVADAVAGYLARPASVERGPTAWDVVDLRRLRCGDPAADELAAALLRREADDDWTVNVEREDVCPVAVIPDGEDIQAFLDTLGKKERHEIRRKVRRAEAAGEVRLTESRDPSADLPAFIDLHQKRWGSAGLFPDTPGGEASRLFVRRLFELFGPHGPVRLSFLTVGARRIAAGIHLQDAARLYYYNAGVDPAARDLSPGVVMIAKYVELAIANGLRRFDFLRGDEPYKYEWGAVDEPIQRILVRRSV